MEPTQSLGYSHRLAGDLLEPGRNLLLDDQLTMERSFVCLLLAVLWLWVFNQVWPAESFWKEGKNRDLVSALSQATGWIKACAGSLRLPRSGSGLA